MTDPNKLYESYIREGSYFNLMLNCGDKYNQWVQNALYYLPQDILDEHKENIVFISTAHLDACRVARYFSEKREIIILSERILPKQHANEGQPEVRYFIYTVLHEVVHAIKNHKSPKFDKLTREEIQAQEDEADKMASEWFNQHVKERDNPHLKPLTEEEVKLVQEWNQCLMEKQYAGLLRDCSKCKFDFKEADKKETEI